jgi:KUP system potassium uptake protein
MLPQGGHGRWLLALLALGVVYGDIGTSPLYSVSECFAEHGTEANPANVLGVLSLITWSLILAVSVKYLGFVLRADNRGEGGILALSALVAPRLSGRSARIAIFVGLFGAAFLFSDGIITPAISVLSAVEGVEVSAPALTPWVVPTTIAIIVLLFAFQYRGTAGVGAVFGPAMAVYFAVIAALGVHGVAAHPEALSALDPRHALRFFADNGPRSYLVLGAVFLVVTGGEALYADLGHFGKRPIRLAWFVVVLPALLANYYGQGALLLGEPKAQNPFYELAPPWAQLPLVVISTIAAVIASQAVISGTFSLASQAIQLGYCPRMAVRHTSSTAIGQIYVPAVNWMLMVACVLLVAEFGSSTRLASAYGVAIAMTMVVTSALFYLAARHVWRWPRAVVLIVTGAFLALDCSYLGATLAKVEHGGWFPLLVTGALVVLMTTWSAGRRRLADRLRGAVLPLDQFIADITARKPRRVPGTAVFLASNADAAPSSLLHNLKHNQVLHERVVVMTVRTVGVPYVAADERATLTERGQGIVSVAMRYGFNEVPNVPQVLAALLGVAWKPMETSYFLGRESLVVTGASGMGRWRGRLFAWMSRNALNAAAFFSLPPNRVVELGMQVEV